jgi:hypothetical protein
VILCKKVPELDITPNISDIFCANCSLCRKHIRIARGKISLNNISM